MTQEQTQYPPLPPDDLTRALTLAQADGSKPLQHIGLVGDTYTITVSGDETQGRFCVIDMHVPPGGGPGPHRHDFEETSSFSRARRSSLSVGKSPPYEPGTRSIFRPTLPTTFTMLRQSRFE